MSIGTLHATHQLMLLTQQELLRAHALMDTVEVPREASAAGEKLSISQRVEQLVKVHRDTVRALVEALHK
jgi:hypothetical protein